MHGDGFHRIGHGGASALARGNTLASFDAAVEIGIDMVEFDVRACGRELVLAHTLLHARRSGNVRLRDAITHLSSPKFADVGLGVDLKHVGCEPAALEALELASLLDRALLCSQVLWSARPGSLAAAACADRDLHRRPTRAPEPALGGLAQPRAVRTRRPGAGTR